MMQNWHAIWNLPCYFLIFSRGPHPGKPSTVDIGRPWMTPSSKSGDYNCSYSKAKFSAYGDTTPTSNPFRCFLSLWRDLEVYITIILSLKAIFKSKHITCPVAVTAALTVAVLMVEVTLRRVPKVFERATFCCKSPNGKLIFRSPAALKS